jgi:hypothetical protein
MKEKVFVAIVVSALLGFIHFLASEYLWSYLVVVNPLPLWLARHGVTGDLWRTLVFTQDALINIVLCLPLVFVLRVLRPFHPWAYLAVAMLVGEAWNFRGVFAEPLPPGLGYSIYLPGLLMTVVAFVVSGAAAWALARSRQSSS